MNPAMLQALLAIAVQALTAVRNARDAAKAANPVGEDGTIPFTDPELIAKLKVDGAKLEQEAAELGAWARGL
jgi:hypothetical protein